MAPQMLLGHRNRTFQMKCHASSMRIHYDPGGHWGWNSLHKAHMFHRTSNLGTGIQGLLSWKFEHMLCPLGGYIFLGTLRYRRDDGHAMKEEIHNYRVHLSDLGLLMGTSDEDICPLLWQRSIKLWRGIVQGHRYRYSPTLKVAKREIAGDRQDPCFKLGDLERVANRRRSLQFG